MAILTIFANFFIDTEEEICECIYIPIKPSNEAFDLDKIEKSKKIGLSQETEMDLSNLKDMLLNKETGAIEFSDVVSMVCSQYKSERNMKINVTKLESILQRAQSNV